MEDPSATVCISAGQSLVVKQESTIRHAIIARTCFGEYISLKSVLRYIKLHQHCTTVFVEFFLVRNCVGQQSFQDISILKLHVLGFHAECLFGN